MKRELMAFVAIMLIAVVGCKKDTHYPPQHPPVPVDDARTVLLKDVVAQSLPNPYFRFTYDDQHYVTQINFASGLNIYNVEYENKRVKKMTNINNNNTLLYSYHNNRVSEINEFSGTTGNKGLTYQFSYNNNNQLTQVLWWEFFTDSNGKLFKKSVLTYYPDGNLEAIDSYNTGNGPLSLAKRDEFSNYDNQTNVDDFYLLEDFFDSFLFLPQVKLQKNNPKKQLILGEINDFQIDYTYEFQNNLPVKKTGIFRQTRGGNSNPVQFVNQLTYY